MRSYKIYRDNVIINEFVLDASQSDPLSGDKSVSFTISSKNELDIKIRDYILVDDVKYSLFEPIDVEESNGMFTYPLVFYWPGYQLNFSLIQDEGATTFPYHGGIGDFILLLIDSLKKDYSEFTIGEVEENGILDLSFDNSSCMAALQTICEAADMEWNINNTVINVKKRIGIDTDYTFEYGKNKGGYSVKLAKVANASIVTRMIGKGGTSNLPVDYISPDSPKRLNLGNEILEKNIDKYGRITGVYVNDNIYPRLVNKTVLDVTIPEDIEKAGSWKLKLDIPFDLSQQYAPDQIPVVKFQTGDLTGSDFEIIENSYNNTDKTLSIIVKEDDGYYLPNKDRQPRVGDVFVLLNIIMPYDPYVTDALTELRKATQDELDRKCEPQFAPTLVAQRHYLERNNIRLNIGDGITVKTGSQSITTRILAISQTSSSDEINFELGDQMLYSYDTKVNNTIEQIQTTLKQLISIEDIKRLFNNLINKWYPLWFDQKLHKADDVTFNSVDTTSHIRTEDISSHEFNSGPLGRGYRIQGNGDAEFQNVNVRGTFSVNEFLIQQAKAVGGKIIVSPASIKINKAEETPSGYKCSFNTDGGAIINPFIVNDQGFHQVFDSTKMSRYWRLITEVGSDYFVMSKTGCESGSGIPKVDDEIILLGNRTNQARQSAIIISAYDNDSPYTAYYSGINGFSLAGKEVMREGNLNGIVDSAMGQLEGFGLYAKNAYIRGQLWFSSGKDAETAVNDASQKADSAQSDLNDYRNATNATLEILNAVTDDLQSQVDGTIMAWDGSEVPTLNNYPASEWTTDEEKARHKGDYYDRFFMQDGKKVTERYKFTYENNTYQWTQIADSSSALALQEAREALGIAGTKAALIYGDSIPTAPYNINDIWIKQISKEQLISKAQRLEGYGQNAADWEVVNNTQIRLAQMASDNVISKEEKATLRNDKAQVDKEYAKYQSDATKYGVSVTALQAAYNALVAFLNNTVKISQDTDFTFSGLAQQAQYNQLFADYYAARTDFANIIADKISRDSIDNLQPGDVNLIDYSNKGWKNSNYLMAAISLGDYKPKEGEECTIVMKGKLGTGKSIFGIYNSGGTVPLVNIYLSYFNSDNIASRTFKWRVGVNNSSLYIYTIPDSVTVESEIEWIKLVSGNKTSLLWTPSLNDQHKDIQNAVDGIVVGGANLADNTQFWNDADGWSWWGSPAHAANNGVLSIVNAEATQNVIAVCPPLEMTAGEEYTLSAEIRSDNITTLNYNHVIGSYWGGNNQQIGDIGITSEWQKYKITFKAKYTQKSGVGFGFQKTGSLQVRKFKLEKGNKATDYSLSENDQKQIASEEAGKVVDKLEIGNVNILNNSGNFGDTIKNWYDNGGGLTVDSAVKYNGYNTIKTAVGAGIAGDWYKLENGVEYCYSAMIKSDAGFAGSYSSPLHFQSGYGNNNEGKREILDFKQSAVANEWTLLHVTFKLTGNADSFRPFIYWGSTVIGNFNIAFLCLTRGNKPMVEWSPSLKDQGENIQGAIDNTHIGSQNLISRKMMLAWNNVNPNIVKWGQDSDGVYLNVDHKLLTDYISEGSSAKDVFGGVIKYKANTQYVFSVEWKVSANNTYGGIRFVFYYTDGSSQNVSLNGNQTTKAHIDYVTDPGKTISKISSTHGTYAIRSFIYNISLIEGNKPLQGFPVAEEDQTGASNVNYLDNGNFTFEKEGYALNQDVTLTLSDNVLQARSSQTGSTPGLVMPIMTLKAGVYTLNVKLKGVNINETYNCLYTSDLSTRIYAYFTGITNNSSIYNSTIVVPEDGQYRMLLLWDASQASAYPAGFDLEWATFTPGMIGSREYFESENDAKKRLEVVRRDLHGEVVATQEVFKTVYDEQDWNVLGEKIAEYNSTITQTAQDLLLTQTSVNNLTGQVEQLGIELSGVSGELSLFAKKGEIINSINLSPEGIRINANKIEITGQTLFKDSNNNEVAMFKNGKVINVNNGVFSVDNTGRLVCTNADISGKITANSGEIAGMKISNNGIKSADFNPNTKTGSCYAKDGFSVYASGTGVLIPSSGLLQAGIITAIGNNADITGLEIIAKNTSSYAFTSTVTALRISAINSYNGDPINRPVAIEVKAGITKLYDVEVASVMNIKSYTVYLNGLPQRSGSGDWRALVMNLDNRRMYWQ